MILFIPIGDTPAFEDLDTRTAVHVNDAVRLGFVIPPQYARAAIRMFETVLEATEASTHHESKWAQWQEK
jgi:hypothetical protein